MGNDGGSIPTRRELVKSAARAPTAAELKETQHEQQAYAWSTDPISQKPLARPVVSDAAGRLYNKDTILEYLVEGTRKEEAERVTQRTVQSLRDVVEVRFEVETQQGDGSAKRPADAPSSSEIWRCPITGDRLGPGSKAVYLATCGHAFSRTAIDAVATSDAEKSRCLTCEIEYTSGDVIPILPTAAADVAKLAQRIKALQEKGLAHSLKKAASASKKRKKKPADDAGDAVPADEKPTKQTAVSNGINNASTALLTAKVMQEQEQNKRRRMENANVKSLFTARTAT